MSFLECPSCYGTGTATGDESEPCRTCGGSGRVLDEERPCPMCNGTGVRGVEAMHMTCIFCGGKGVVR